MSSSEPGAGIQRVWFVRHGQVAENLTEHDHPLTAEEYNRMIQGSDETPLNEVGCRQIEAVAETFAGRPIPAVHSSPLPRALETAGLLAERLDVPVVRIQGFRELVPAEIRPILYRGGRRKLRHWFLRSMVRQFLPISRKGETIWRARRRVRAAWRELLAWESPDPSSERLVAAHRGTVMLLVSVLRFDRRWRVVRWSIENGGITEIVRA